MNYAAIKTCDIANGPGVRTSLFVSLDVRTTIFSQQCQYLLYRQRLVQRLELIQLTVRWSMSLKQELRLIRRYV